MWPVAQNTHPHTQTDVIYILLRKILKAYPPSLKSILTLKPGLRPGLFHFSLSVLVKVHEQTLTKFIILGNNRHKFLILCAN